VEVELTTAQLFDLGVFLVVVGTTQSVILNISGDRGGDEEEDDAGAGREAPAAPGAGEVRVGSRPEGEGGEPWNS